MRALEWRCIGPHRGGRSVAVAGDPTDEMRFYFGACDGGVWKTGDGGTYWENVSDGYLGTAAIGAIAVAESDPNVLYVGTGEACIRNDVSSGDGVYKSTDAGATWRHVGLADTRHIGRVRVDPHNPDLVYVAALGHAWAPNDERGIFRSTDGGGTWERVLFGGAGAGGVDLCLDPSNPRELYATLWEVYRTPWTISSGGPGSGLYKSVDSGDTWTELSANPGLPSGIKGRIGVAVSAAQPGRVWAMVEAADGGGLYRSDDGGAGWTLTNDTDGRGRPWYHSHVVADPQDPDTVWLMDNDLSRSTDGGHSFTVIPAPHGDHHDLWIDPRNPRRMINGADGGATVTFNGGRSWSTIYNQPTACFYHLAVDDQHPYRVAGTQQDNSAISVPSRTAKGHVPYGECYQTGFSESGHIVISPDDPNVVYSGCTGSSPAGIGDLYRSNHAADDHAELMTVWPEDFFGWAPKDQKYRFQWTYPIVISPHDPDCLLVAGNQVFRSRAGGDGWEVISPDLTRDDPDKQVNSGGPITIQGVTGADTYCTIFALAESPLEKGVLWAGSDDGLLHLSRDDGATWQDVTPPGLPEWTTIAVIEPSRHDPAAAYVAAYRYKLDDYRPYLYATDDFGATWREITEGIGAEDFTRVIREDPARPGLLYAGTETGLHVSLDDGASWHRFPSMQAGGPRGRGLPVVPIYDLAVKGSDLVVATHGRSFWILDDLTPLRQLGEEGPQATTRLFAPRRTEQEIAEPSRASSAPAGWRRYVTHGGAVYHEIRREDGSADRLHVDAGDNPPHGVLVTYLLTDPPEGEAVLTFLEADGREIARFTSAPDPAGTPDGPAAQRVPVEVGMHRFVWDMRHPAPWLLPNDPLANYPTPNQGPEVSPGHYEVRLTVGGETFTEGFDIVKDRRIDATDEQLQARCDLLLKIRDALTRTYRATDRLRQVREQAREWARRAGADTEVARAADRLAENLSAIEAELIQPKVRTSTDTTKYPTKLSGKLRTLSSGVTSMLTSPTRQSLQVFEALIAGVDEQLASLDRILRQDVPALNELVRAADLPAIEIPE
ncbi:MAG: glycosyl hydrolase [Candidatus Dormiibacterota bacterium]